MEGVRHAWKRWLWALRMDCGMVGVVFFLRVTCRTIYEGDGTVRSWREDQTIA